MLDKLKKLFGAAPEKPATEGDKKPKITEKPATEDDKKPKVKRSKSNKQERKTLTSKEKATLAGEPYVSILSVDVDPNNINSGSFELDWNDKFVVNLVKAGYKTRPDDTDQVIVDRWFQTVCRNIALEVYEQRVADPVNRDMEDIRRIHRKDIGDGRSEVS